MKRIFILPSTKSVLGLAVIMVMVLVFSLSAHAALSNRSTDSLGNRLIYDSDLNITWYDYTKSWDTWQNQMNWAGALDVDFGGTHYTDWRLPTTVDGPYVFGYDGTTTAGYNITSSEMGHLYYTELGNLGWYDTSGNPTGCSSSSPWCLTNTGDFQNLQTHVYWSGTEYAANTGFAWLFLTPYGGQGSYDYGYGKGDHYYALAVRPGDVAVVPEPVSMVLFVTGGAVLAARRKLSRRRHG